MARSLLFAIVAFAVALVAAGCGDDDTVTAPEGLTGEAAFQPAAAGSLVRWYETPGECQECGFTLDLDASGSATFVGHEAESTVTYDAAELRDRLEAVGQTPLVIGTDDCGREVDGNAPVLELVAADGDVTTVDDCYEEIDREHPVMEVVLSVLDDARSAAGIE